MPMLHFYRVADLHTSASLTSRASEVGFEVLASEVCFNIEA
eukprot:CAMPEP_0115324476 /NCGR_PEP_ID=MMETSP0270-20121206/82497_1 /TAXON_ID=71861 /ORGANISM="Scrippsiella trochoidea, Strain CCMP3099" /LENGTH=40 /DNA_ID= /DNA_START= /DNA_END= /DNA_ORIENTATION=